MTYLSRIWLNPLRTGAQALLKNPQRMHAAALGGLSRQPVTERVLWRLETGEGLRGADRPHRAEVLVLTESTPSWEHLIEQAGWIHTDEPQVLVRDYQPLLDRLHTGREFRFRLRANTVSATRTPDNPSPAQKEHLAAPRPRGVRVGHRTAAHQTTWLTDRIDRWGFTLLTTADLDGPRNQPDGPGDTDEPAPALRLTARERLTFPKKAKNTEKTGRRVVLNTATFEGALRVTDPARARATLLHGVGPAKAYGCGLITLAPLHTEQAGR
ncbi:type I-E CRISPR-associated protein Cas6/Cse3/CasE [Frankia sp. BMG5.23]|uniref:type I-E CRISPR-associated protein Cas6/Cse3/CasE n=1 Tax=Frankia sp. BMG5.23 TaxID=683305 RepID=UPI0004615823|nr:type I-E CRISPR-associated protein Cas6/Cse3/CasE [Frankia sp. BMG5.23]KDA44374.1 CRISPR-associated protein, Cse3 family [Frankia sp. BMG5.23]